MKTAVTPSGKLINLLCTHAKCVVKKVDDKYECPCHGSEFDLEGKVLKGPAKRDLETING